MALEPTAEETKPRPNQHFIPALKDKKVMIRMVSGGQPISGTLVAYNPYELLIKNAKGSTLVFKREEYIDGCQGNFQGDDMKGIIAISLILLAGLASAYTPEQQMTLDGMDLSYKLGMAYAIASQGQNVAEYNTLVDEYNAWIRQNFGEDASLLKSTLNISEMPAPTATMLVIPADSGVSYLAAPFNTSSDLSKFGKPMHLVAGAPAQSQEDDIIQAKAEQFLSS